MNHILGAVSENNSVGVLCVLHLSMGSRESNLGCQTCLYLRSKASVKEFPTYRTAWKLRVYKIQDGQLGF